MVYTLMDNQEKTQLRRRFIERFADTSKEYYRERIESRDANGLCYNGYLWDCLKDNEAYQYCCSMDRALSSLAGKGNVFVMWDIYSLKRVQLHCKWTDWHPMDSVIRVDACELCGVIQNEWDAINRDHMWLPEDLYVFDESMSWATIFTHEYWDATDGGVAARICFVVE